MNTSLIIPGQGDLQDVEQLSFEEQLKQAVNHAASQNVLEAHLSELAENTRKGQITSILLFARFLRDKFLEMQAQCEDAACVSEFDAMIAKLGTLHTSTQNWSLVGHGHVQAFKKWLVNDGYAIGTVNVRLSHVRIFARCAFQAGDMAEKDYNLIKLVSGFTYKAGLNRNETRARNGLATRKDHKKANATTITAAQVDRLKVDHAATPQGARDRLLFCLLADWGLRASELAGLDVGDVDQDAGTIRVWRKKTKTETTINVTSTPDTWSALQAYLALGDAPKEGHLLAGSKSVWIDGDDKKRRQIILHGRMSERAIAKRVRQAGDRLGIDHLSPHDLRHYAATYLAKVRGYGVRRLMDVFGWSSPSMAIRYVESDAVVSQD